MQPAEIIELSLTLCYSWKPSLCAYVKGKPCYGLDIKSAVCVTGLFTLLNCVLILERKTHQENHSLGMGAEKI
jgi:hypothetical protein